MVKFRPLVLLFLFSLLAASPSFSWEVTGTKRYLPVNSWYPYIVIGSEQEVVCYLASNRVMLDCPFTSTLGMNSDPVLPPLPFDGHANHAENLRTWGYFYIVPSDIAFQYTATYGNTNGTIAFFNYLPSEIAGHYVIDTYYQFPQGYFCLYPPDCHTKTYLEVGITGMERLPDTGPTWEVVRGGTANHPDANWLRNDAKQTLMMIAQIYYMKSGRLLSINDMSLPLGGMFDLDGQYSTNGGHTSHRRGLDADINTYGGTIPCRDDTALKEAIVEVKKKKGHYAKLKCEDAVVNGQPQADWRKHIDFN